MRNEERERKRRMVMRTENRIEKEVYGGKRLGKWITRVESGRR